MDAKEIAGFALKEVERSLATARAQLGEMCRANRDVMHEAEMLVLKGRQAETGVDISSHMALNLLHAVMKDNRPPLDPEVQANLEIIQRPHDLSVHAAVKHERDAIGDLLARTTEAVWNESVAKTRVLFDGPNFQIVEIESAEGTVRNAQYTWTGPKKQEQPS